VEDPILGELDGVNEGLVDGNEVVGSGVVGKPEGVREGVFDGIDEGAVDGKTLVGSAAIARAWTGGADGIGTTVGGAGTASSSSSLDRANAETSTGVPGSLSSTVDCSAPFSRTISWASKNCWA